MASTFALGCRQVFIRDLAPLRSGSNPVGTPVASHSSSASQMMGTSRLTTSSVSFPSLSRVLPHPHHFYVRVHASGRPNSGSSQQSNFYAKAAPTMAPESAPAGSEELSEKGVIDMEAELFVRTYARAPIVIARGKGCKVYDINGKEYLDMTAGIAVNALGHGDPAWVQAVQEQAEVLAHVSNLYHTVPQVKLAEKLIRSSFADRIFYTNSGTEANEAAIKFCRKFAQEQARPVNQPPATHFVAFTNCFHGRTMGALALTSKKQYRDPFAPVMPGAETFVPYGDLEAAAAAIQRGKTAAVFVEPVQGEGGIHLSTVEFLRGLRRLCDAAGALLVFDEVQCGLGRTGHLFAHQAYGVTPDIMTLAKPLAGGLPIGCVLTTDRVADVIKPGDHGSTFAGNPLVCHVAAVTLERIMGAGFLEGVQARGDYLRGQLRKRLAGSPHVKEVRGMGLLVGIQLDAPAGPLVTACREAGVLVITAGAGDVVRLVPPLIITENEIDFAVDTIANAIHFL